MDRNDVPAGAWIILKDEAGPMFEQQAGGYACAHPTARGFLVPLPEGVNGTLSGYFVGPKWSGWCCDGIDTEDADFIDNELAKEGIYVDRALYDQSMEAWIHVSYKGRPAVLTFDNSD